MPNPPPAAPRRRAGSRPLAPPEPVFATAGTGHPRRRHPADPTGLPEDTGRASLAGPASDGPPNQPPHPPPAVLVRYPPIVQNPHTSCPQRTSTNENRRRAQARSRRRDVHVHYPPNVQEQHT